MSREIIPRQLALETLDSLQKILFPFDYESITLLNSIASEQDFDPDCLEYDSVDVDYRRDDEKEVVYYYWGSRLMNLLNEIENTKPRGIVHKWLERRSRGRHVMIATIVGIIIAVVLGVLSLVVAIFQAWVSNQQWKDPISKSSS